MMHLLALLLFALGTEALRLPNASKRMLTNRETILNASLQSKPAIGWDSHEAVKAIPASLVKEIDGNAGMRAKFEQLCRKSQVSLKISTFCTLYSKIVACRQLIHRQRYVKLLKISMV